MTISKNLDIIGNVSYIKRMNAQRKQREWTPEQRLEQSRKLRERQIWLKSTGPRTTEGKSTSSRNARSADYLQHQEIRHINAYLRTQNHYRKLLSYFTKRAKSLPSHVQNAINMQLCFFENELIDLERKIFGGLRFSQIMDINYWRNQENILPFSRLRR